MKIRPRETYEQKFNSKPTAPAGQFGSVDYLKFKKNNVYQFFIVPKVVFIDLENDECEIDYPFEEVSQHYGTYDFMKTYGGLKSTSIICSSAGCAIDKWLAETKVPKSVFKIAVGTKFQLAYVIHEKKIKVAWFQDYLYDNLKAALSRLMADNSVNLIDAFRHRVKVFTNSEGKMDVEIDHSVSIPTESEGFKSILKSVCEKPLETTIENSIAVDASEVEPVVDLLRKYNVEIIEAERDRAQKEKMEEKSQMLAAAVDGFSDYKAGGNEVITDDGPIESVGPLAGSEPEEDEENPF